MGLRILHSPVLRSIAIVFVLLASGLIFAAQTAAAQGERTELVIGLQNDMTTLNYFNPDTNTVWNAYQVEWGFEGLFSSTPDNIVFPLLANPDKGTSGPGYKFIVAPPAAQPVVDVYIRPGVTFSDGQPMTVDDVVFTYQVLEWSTYQTFIGSALWWDAPRFAHWTGGAAKSHVGVEVSPAAADAVRFTLSKSYALFFLATLQIPIIPKHIWTTHINPSPQLNLTSLTPIADSADKSADFSFGSRPNEINSVMGTGMFKFDSWSPNLGSHISAYTGYWGQGKSVQWAGTAYSLFPEHLRSIKFVIFTSLDVISLALQKGDIDTLIWSLTPGFLTQVRLNPAIGVETVTDAGYFYMAFNLRRKPWNDLNLRKAISMAIDKDYIVNTLMGGFGVKGNWPISIHASTYVNASTSLPGFDINGAKALLDSVGIVDRNGDGFREYSDGSPIKTTILTPPKDYDPVRADAGIMISNNLKLIGLNIDAAPTSFDTIVAKAFTQVDFDIYILGFLLTGTPETYLTDFFHSKNDVAINPGGSNSAGLHDSVTDALLDKMEITLDDTARTKIVKDIESRVNSLIPWNILYYRKNLNAYRNDRWVGWVNTPPQLYNFWSLVKIHNPGSTTPPPNTGVFSIALTAPERALFGRTVKFEAFVSQNFAPVSGATVWLNSSFGGLAATGTTDVTGHVAFTWTVPLIQGVVTLTAEAGKGGAKASTLKQLSLAVGPPAPIAKLNLSTTKPIIGIGQSTTITATLVDGTGSPIPGVTVSLDTKVTLGVIGPSSAGSDVTSSAGKATFTYTSPATAGAFANQHFADLIKAYVNVSNKVASDTQYASMIVFVSNSNAPDWRIVRLQSSTKMALNTSLSTQDTLTISVNVTDYAGTALSGKDVDVVLPSDGAWNVIVTPASPGSNKTVSSGIASFTIVPTASARAGQNVTTVPVRFVVRNDASQVNDEVGILLYSSASSGHYAATLGLSTRAMPALNPTTNATNTADVTIQVTDKLGLPAAGVPVIFQINYGPLGLPAEFPWNYDYGSDYGTPVYLGGGLDLNSFGIGSIGGNFTSNPGQAFNSMAWGVENFVEDYESVGDFPLIDACDPTGNATIQNGVLEAFGALPLQPWPTGFKQPWLDYTKVGGTYILNVTSTTNLLGQYTVPLSALPHRMDNSLQIRAYVGEKPGTKFNVTVDDCNFVAKINNNAFVTEAGMVIARSPVFALGSAWFDQPAFTSQDEIATVHARFYTKDGPLADPEVFLVRGAGSAARNVGLYNTTSRASAATFGTIHPGIYPFVGTYSNDVLTWQVRDQFSRRRVFDHSTWPWTFHDVFNGPLGASQTIYYAFVPADMRFAYGGRDQMFAGSLGDYWIAPTFATLIAKVPFEFRIGYYFVPGGIYASVSVDKTLVPEQGTATATVTATDQTGSPVVGATVFSGPFQNVTDATGKASFVFGASSGAVENLVVVAAPNGEIARAWYGIMASPPVLSYATPTVTAKEAGQASTISVVVTNQVPVGGTATVLLTVDGNVVAAKTITIGASATQTVTFDYVFQQSGTYTVGVGGQTASAAIPAHITPTDYTWLITLIAGLAVGAVVGVLALRMRGKRPPGMEAETGAGPKPSEEELPPEENL